MVKQLMAVQDALSRRRAREIHELRQRYIPVADVEREAEQSQALIAAPFARVPGDLAAAIAREPDAGAVYQLLDVALRRALHEAADAVEQAAASHTEAAPPSRPPRLRPSRSLPEAQSRNAKLRAQLIELRERIR